jgi:hypothetical protein
MAIGIMPIAVECVAVLAMDIELLVPDVREVVLIELQHAEYRKPISGNGSSYYEGAHGYFH